MTGSTTTKKEIYVFDSAVPDLQTLIDAVSAANPDPTIIILKSGSDGVLQLADALASEFNLDAIHLFSHGSVGSLQLGSAILNDASLPGYSKALAQIGQALTAEGDLLLYGCNVAQGELGQLFIERLAGATGADVAASEDLTGAAGLGGDWELEASSGIVEQIALTSNLSGTLGPIAANSHFNYNDALISAIFANAAYIHESTIPTTSALESTLVSLDWTPLKTGAGGNLNFDSAGGYQNSNAYGFSAKTVLADGTVTFVLSYEGSNLESADWTTTNALEYGWSNYYASLMPLMTEMVNQALTEKITNSHNVKILITGHSLGGAVAEVAFADLFLAPTQNFWIEDHAPLKSGSRIYAQAALNGWTDAQINSLIVDTSVYTFGAPSFLIEPTKFNQVEYANLTKDLVVDIWGKQWFDVVWDLGSAVSETVTVDESLVPVLLGFENYVFQFEHKDSDQSRLPDPVSSLGTIDAGTVLDIDISGNNHDRYNDIYSPSFLAMHSMGNYLESVSRLLTASLLLKNVLDAPMLPWVQAGSNDSDLLISSYGINALGGNDIIIASGNGGIFNGGYGQDAYVIKQYEEDIFLTGPDGEKLDKLYFNLFGTISADAVVDDTSNSLTFRIKSPGGESTVTINDWYSYGYNYQLDSIFHIRPLQHAHWTTEQISLDSLNVYGFLNGDAANNKLLGSSTADTMVGGAGDDIMGGRGGNDVIYGDDIAGLLSGNDTISGGLGSDTLYGGAGDDLLSGGDGNDHLVGGAGNNYLSGGDGSDELYGGVGNDWLDGEGGIDSLYGGAGNDTLVADNSSDLLVGDIGNDEYDIHLVGSGCYERPQ